MEKYDSRLLVLEEVRKALQLQRERRSSMESKGGLLLGFIGGIFALMMGGYSVINGLSLASRLLTITAIILLALSIVFLLTITHPRQMRVDPNPRAFAEKYRLEPFEDSSEQLTSILITAFEENDKVVEGIAKALGWAYLLTATGLGCLAVGLLVSLFN
jgi:hypothetical protein